VARVVALLAVRLAHLRQVQLKLEDRGLLELPALYP
jgi:hypothetical protein